MKPVPVILTAAVVAVIAAYGTVKLAAPSHVTEKKTESVYDRVMRTKTIRCGYAPIEPLLRKDANGKLSGLTYDLMNKVGEKLGLKIEWAGEAGFASMTQDIISGRYDIICSAHMITSARARVVDFTVPVVFAPLNVFVRNDDDRFDTDQNLLNSEKITFSSIVGTPVPALIQDFFPKAKMVSLPELSTVAEVFLAVQNKKAEVTVAPAYEGRLFAEKNNGSVRPVGNPLILMPNVFQLPQNEYRFKAMIDASLEELRANGFIDRLVEKYRKYPDALYASRSPSAPILRGQ